MSLTTAQLATLKADIIADPILNAKAANSDGAFDIAAAYNLIVAPTFYVWRTSVQISEVMLNGFDWTRVDNLTVGKARIWEWMTQLGSINPSQANVRAGVLACFSVAAGDLPNRQAIFDHSERPASRVEKLFAAGAGTASNDQGVGPATMAFEGPLNYQDVLTARG